MQGWQRLCYVSTRKRFFLEESSRLKPSHSQLVAAAEELLSGLPRLANFHTSCPGISLLAEALNAVPGYPRSLSCTLNVPSSLRHVPMEEKVFRSVIRRCGKACRCVDVPHVYCHVSTDLSLHFGHHSLSALRHVTNLTLTTEQTNLMFVMFAC